jgi:UDP-glucose 4-epimerase
LADNKSAQMTILDNLSVGNREDLAIVCDFTEVIPSEALDGKGVRLVVGDVRDFDVVAQCTKSIDCLVHLAATTGVGPSVENPRTDMESNVIGTFNVLEAARIQRVKRFVFASSGAPIGEVEPPIHEELAPHPVSPYGASKLAGEGYCSAYFRTFGIETVVLRFGNVYGPGSNHKSSVVAKFIRQAMHGEMLEIYGDGNQTRDFIYIKVLTHESILN